jgi:hypothetical protein
VINKKPRHTLGVVKNLTEGLISASHVAPVRQALARMSTSVILDQYGCIRACGQHIAALAEAAGQVLHGQPIRSLLPTLPFQAGTPGYNVAFAVFHANTQRRTVCEMKIGDGVPLTVDISLSILETQPAYLFSLDIRKHASLAVIVPDASTSGQQQPLFQRCA